MAFRKINFSNQLTLASCRRGFYTRLDTGPFTRVACATERCNESARMRATWRALRVGINLVTVMGGDGFKPGAQVVRDRVSLRETSKMLCAG